MKAIDVMVRDVITIGPDDSIADAAKLIADNDVSALPVVDDDGHLVGIISEGDLMSREEIGAAVHHPWWIEAVTPAATLAAEFAKSHGKKVAEVMSENVITAKLAGVNSYIVKPFNVDTLKMKLSGVLGTF